MKWHKNIGFRVIGHTTRGYYIADWGQDGFYTLDYYDYHLKTKHKYLGKFIDLDSAKKIAESIEGKED